MIIFISGGVRSGKSSLAERMAMDLFKKLKAKGLYYVATSKRNIDEEMNHRIKLHQESRTSQWTTIEEPYFIHEKIQLVPNHSVLLVDCLTVWSSNVLFSENKSYQIMIERLKKLFDIARLKQLTIIFVSNDLNEEIPILDEGVQSYLYSLQAVHKYVVSQSDRAIQVVAGSPINWK
ncbi:MULTISPECIES: bifunctional adenosylcobinamide kinase/adenosylcobinamide-phosphate guanylyltransferase [Bacillus]|uniref:bifunctional adenosylcobinamide kinase/adenosylcobinamide-phosphate guanylyltransferase n=1 Tax=Bacillus TaxID=1386 RepID=UPI00030B1FE0|nr:MULTISPECIES: bifunctional adenosylcobinamide kinase/adenosylcobinamide-phosphate guanylyltransferase [Bacillus]